VSVPVFISVVVVDVGATDDVVRLLLAGGVSGERFIRVSIRNIEMGGDNVFQCLFVNQRVWGIG
jgi:hypothetical protein